MQEKLDAVCFGEIALDFRYLVDSYPAEGSGTLVRAEAIAIGGDAAIIAHNLSLMGLNIGLTGNDVGVDENGNRLRSLLQQRVKTCLPETDEKTPYNVVLVSGTGERTWFTFKGTTTCPQPDPALDVLTPARVAYVDTGFTEAAELAVRKLRLQSIPVVLRAGPWTREALLDGALTVVRSAAEAEESPEELMRRDLKKGVQLAVVTEGALGATFGTQKAAWKLAAHRVAAIDSTGAGATFTSGLIYSFLKGEALERQPLFANAMAAVKVEMLGNLARVDLDRVTRLADQSSLLVL